MFVLPNTKHIIKYSHKSTMASVQELINILVEQKVQKQGCMCFMCLKFDKVSSLKIIKNEVEGNRLFLKWCGGSLTSV